MRKPIDIIVLIIALNIYLGYILLFDFNELNLYEQIIISSGLIFLNVFLSLIFLNKNEKDWVDVIHLIYCLYAFILSCFVDNFNLLVFFGILILINIGYWTFDGRCPIGSYKNKLIKLVTSKLNFVPFLSFSIISFKFCTKLSN